MPVRLTLMSSVGSCVTTLTGSAAVDTHACETAARDAARKQMTESKRIYLAFPRSGVSSAIRIAGAVVDVLEIEEYDDPLRLRAAQWRGPKNPKRSPAGSGRPERRGRLLEVYLTGAGAQAKCGHARVTMRHEPTSRTWAMYEDKESAGGMRPVWNRLGGGSRVTITAHG